VRERERERGAHKSLIYFRLDSSFYDNPSESDDVNSLDHLLFVSYFFLLLGRFTRNIRDYELLVAHKVDQREEVSCRLMCLSFFRRDFDSASVLLA
jgi:hypothetical protein